MSGAVGFSVSVEIKNPGILAEIQERLADLRPAFEAIIPEWVSINEQKFGMGRGAEIGGVEVDDGVYWQPLTERYRLQKHPNGPPKRKTKAGEYPDWLMVRTGALMTALTDPDTIFQAVTAQDAVFGSPLDPDLAAIVGYQWVRRQAVFLGTADKNMVRRIIGDYLNMGPDFESIRMSKGLAAVAQKAEAEQMDMDFTNTTQDSSWGE